MSDQFPIPLFKDVKATLTYKTYDPPNQWDSNPSDVASTSQTSPPLWEFWSKGVEKLISLFRALKKAIAFSSLK